MKKFKEPTIKNYWPFVTPFSEVMVKKLEEYDYKNGWVRLSYLELLENLELEVEEMKDALIERANAKSVIEECADIANYAMMIADKIKQEIK